MARGSLRNLYNKLERVEVKVLQSTGMSWYEKHIGDTFTVIETKGDKKNSTWTVDDCGFDSWIKKCDCEIV